MELRQLRYFVAVAEELHFRRAAERLYVAQPAVSEQVRKLEAELGVRLFNRTNRHVELTDAGVALLDEGRRVLVQADTAQRAARNARAHSGARLRVGYLPDALPPGVARALGHLAAAPGRIDVSLETGPAVRLIQHVRERRLDAVVASLPAATSDLDVTSLGRQGLVAAVAQAHAHAGARSVDLNGLAPEYLVTLPRAADPAFHDLVLALCRDAGVAPGLVEVVEPRVESVLLGVAAGTGVALLPAAVAERYAAPGVRLIPLDDTGAALETAVITHPDADEHATAAFVRAAVRCVASDTATTLRPARPALRIAA